LVSVAVIQTAESLAAVQVMNDGLVPSESVFCLRLMDLKDLLDSDVWVVPGT
jgi:hypothetical protein